MPSKLLGCIVTVLVLAGCSKVKENLKPVELQPIEATAKLKKSWALLVGKGQDARYARLQPILREGVLYSVDVKGKVTAVDSATGELLWSSRVRSPVGGGLGYSDGILLLGSLKGDVIALSQSDGSELWRTEISSEVLSAPVGDGDVVIAKAIDGRLFALNAKDGEVRWSYDHPVPVLTLRAQAAPVMEGDATYVAFDNGQVLAFASATGQLRWSARVGQPKGKTEIERLVDVDTSPLISGPFVYVAGYQSRVAAITRGTGRVSWSQDTSTFHELLMVDDKLVVVDADSHIKAYDATTGALAWQNDKLHRRDVSAPGLLNGNVVVVDFEGVVHALNSATGEFIARKASKSSPVFAKPVAGDDSVFLLDSDGELRAYTIIFNDEPEEAAGSTRLRRGARPTHRAGN